TIVFNAVASDVDGTVAKVEFFQGAVKLGETAQSPYAFTWNGVPPGDYELTARATDDKGDVTASSIITVRVSEATGSNQAPSVDAGPDQTMIFPAAISLAGVVSDDGLPNPPARTDLQWSKVSGPAGVVFSNGGSAHATASVSTPGIYTLRLT